MSRRCHLLLNQHDHSWIIWRLFSITIRSYTELIKSQLQAEVSTSSPVQCLLSMAGLSFDLLKDNMFVLYICKQDTNALADATTYVSTEIGLDMNSNRIFE
jgi:hypothetical protein